jgi:hypothetical protein
VRRIPFVNLIQCDARRFWEILLGDDTARDLFLHGLKFHRFDIITRHEDNSRIHRVTDCHPRLALPSGLRSLFRNGFNYREDGIFDKITGTWHFVWIPSTFHERFTLEGWMRAESAAADACNRIAEMTVEARFVGVGATLERLAEHVLRSSWDESAAAMNAWLTERSPPQHQT